MSLGLALTRAEYHEARFKSVIATLESRRAYFDAPFTGDLVAVYSIYEAAAALGAARLLIDELFYVTARRHYPDSDDWDWKLDKIVKDQHFNSPKLSFLRVDESNLLRSEPHLSWYVALNEYRNVLFHRGWREPHAMYYPRGHAGPRLPAPEADAMLVPDLASLGNQAKPESWTYNTRARLETVVEQAMDGLRAFVDAICDLWGVPEPQRGIAEETNAHIIVRLPSPAPHIDGTTMVLPFFSTEAKAQEYRRIFPQQVGEATLQRVPVVEDKTSFGYSVQHLTHPESYPLERPSCIDHIIDPTVGVTALCGILRGPVDVPIEHKAKDFLRFIRCDALPVKALWCWSHVDDAAP